MELGAEYRVEFGFNCGDELLVAFIVVEGGHVKEIAQVAVVFKVGGGDAVHVVKVHHILLVHIEFHVVAHFRVELGFLGDLL